LLLFALCSARRVARAEIDDRLGRASFVAAPQLDGAVVVAPEAPLDAPDAPAVAEDLAKCFAARPTGS
jgi:hypothetical protein